MSAASDPPQQVELPRRRRLHPSAVSRAPRATEREREGIVEREREVGVEREGVAALVLTEREVAHEERRHARRKGGSTGLLGLVSGGREVKNRTLSVYIYSRTGYWA